MKPIQFIFVMILLYTCSVTRESIRYELPPKQAGDDPAKLQTILAFKTKDAEKLFDKDDSLLEGKVDDLKKITGKESSNPIVLKALARIEGKLTNLEKAKAIYEKAGLTNNSHYAWILHDYAEYYKEKLDYLKAEEFYDKSIEIFEKLGDKENLIHLFNDAGNNLESFVEDWFEKNVDSSWVYEAYAKEEQKIEDSNNLKPQLDSLVFPKLHKSKENFLKRKQMISLTDKKDKYLLTNTLYSLGYIYERIWIYQTGKPVEPKKTKTMNEKFGPITKHATQKTIYTNYEDYKKAVYYYEEALKTSKEENNSYNSGLYAYRLAELYYRLNFYDDVNLSVAKMVNGKFSKYDFQLDKNHLDKKKSALYYKEASKFFEKSNLFADAINSLHYASVIYPENGDKNEWEATTSLLLEKVEEYYQKKYIELDKLYSIKYDVGATYVQATQSVEKVTEYFENIKNDKRFTEEFYKKISPHDLPEFMQRYLARNNRYCDAIKWANMEYEIRIKYYKQKPEKYSIENYTHKCELTKGIEQYNSKMSEPSGSVATYFKNRWYDLADIFTLEVFGLGFGAMASVGPIKAGLQVYGTTDFQGEKDKTDSYKFEGVLLLDFQNRLWQASDLREGYFRKGSQRNKLFLKKDTLPTEEYGKISANVGYLYGAGFEFNFFELADFFTGLGGYDLLDDDLSPKQIQNLEKDKRFCHNDLNNELLKSAYDGNFAGVKEAIAKGAKINAENENHNDRIKDLLVYPNLDYEISALRIAVARGHVEIVEFLLEKGASIEDNELNSPMNLAIFYYKYATAKVLIKYKADINKGLRIAAGYRYRSDYTKLFLDAGADVNAKDEYGRTALHEASVKEENEENLKLIFERNPDVNAKTNQGDTPLMIASRNKNLDLVKTLIERKVDINAKNKKGETALKMALDKKDNEIVDYLKSKGAK